MLHVRRNQFRGPLPQKKLTRAALGTSRHAKSTFVSVTRSALVLVLILVGSAEVISQDRKPVYQWTFDSGTGQKTVESVSGTSDTIEGRYKDVAGISGRAIRLDGFTCVIRHPANRLLVGADALTVEAWVALGAYPWTWCPIVAQHQEIEGGYSFEIGPRGELGLKQTIGGSLVSCISDGQVPLNTWTYVAATVENGKGIRLFINGVESGKYETARKPTWSGNAETRIGMNYHAVYPANRIGTGGGDMPYWFSIDGIIDEIRVYREVLPDKDLLAGYQKVVSPGKPDLPLRQLPRVTSTGKFRAYYTKLKYYDEWDEQWPVGSDPDVVVTFADSPVKYVFWRGTRYSPAWVTDNHLWMADQSAETWNEPEGCLEHMQDRHCKYSHVRIIENTDARIVVQWRYAPVSAYDKLKNADDKTGWDLWIDEYYYIYPDATAIRKVNWKTEYMCRPVQFQETIPFTEEGQMQGDVMEPDYLWVANLKGGKQHYEYVADPAATKGKKAPDEPNMQRHNFKSDYDPFIIFEPGNQMNYMSDRNIRELDFPGTCNHWPVGQAYCDGNRVVAADRPASFLGFPISDPVRHDGPDGRSWWNGLYGMQNVSIDDLVVLARSWATPPALTLLDAPGFSSEGYDMSEKSYRITRADAKSAGNLRLKIQASEASPLFNPAILVENWGDAGARIKANGKELVAGRDCRIGHIDRLEGTHMIIWLPVRTTGAVDLEVASEK